MTNYSTPYGDILIGIDAKKVDYKEEENRIVVDVDYALEGDYEHFAVRKEIAFHPSNLFLLFVFYLSSVFLLFPAYLSFASPSFSRFILKFKNHSLDLTKKGLVNVHMTFEENRNLSAY